MISSHNTILAKRRYSFLEKRHPLKLANIHMRKSERLIDDANLHIMSAITAIFKSLEPAKDSAFIDKKFAQAAKEAKLSDKYRMATIDFYEKKEPYPDRFVIDHIGNINGKLGNYNKMKKDIQPTLKNILIWNLKFNKGTAAEQMEALQYRGNPRNIN